MKDNVKGGALTEVTFFILLSLYTPKHGYAIMQFIEEKTGGRLVLGAGSLYGATKAEGPKNTALRRKGAGSPKKSSSALRNSPGSRPGSLEGQYEHRKKKIFRGLYGASGKMAKFHVRQRLSPDKNGKAQVRI